MTCFQRRCFNFCFVTYTVWTHANIGFQWIIKSAEYETANPGQDFDDLEANAFDPEVDTMRPVVSPNAIVDRSVSRDADRRGSSTAPFSPTRMDGTTENEAPQGFAMNRKPTEV